MRLLIAFAAAVILIVAPPIQAQTTTADGVDAFVRGDYQRAVEILKPIAETPGSTDAVAQFFMAMLYEGGIGVPIDVVRACGLYNLTGNRGPFARHDAAGVRHRPAQS